MGVLPLTVGYFYQGTAEAQALIKQGEAVFNAQKFDEAAKFYTAAAAKDPKFYMGGAILRRCLLPRQDYTNAGIWYAKAIAIDPDRETAYRYWGDER